MVKYFKQFNSFQYFPICKHNKALKQTRNKMCKNISEYSKTMIGGAGMAQRVCNGLPRDGPGSIPDGNGVKTKLHVLCKGQ